jgi:acyl-CoA dehydrogenase
MLSRAMERETFGKRLYEHGMTQHAIAESFADLQMARLLTLDCAAALDQVGARQARAAIASLKATVPLLCYAIVDRAVQVHGALGVSGETFLAQALAGTLFVSRDVCDVAVSFYVCSLCPFLSCLYKALRSLRIADGPDDVHRRTVARIEIARAKKALVGRSRL